MISFGKSERNIANLLSEGTFFVLDGKTYKVQLSGKPTCYKGEPKTDIYILAISDYGEAKEIKITFKQQNADFIENKTNSQRAETLLGPNWKEIIKASTYSIKGSFENKKLIYKVKGKRTEEGSITLGWKYEILNKLGGELSGVLNLSIEQVLDIYAGTHLPDDKRNARVKNTIIENSGVANYILVNDTANTAQEVINRMISIEDYVKENPKVYFACKALNYRTYVKKHDGNRPLSVYIDWTIQNNKLKADLIFDNPLEIKGDIVAEKLKCVMKNLGINSTQDINESLVINPKIILGK